MIMQGKRIAGSDLVHDHQNNEGKSSVLERGGRVLVSIYRESFEGFRKLKQPEFNWKIRTEPIIFFYLSTGC